MSGSYLVLAALRVVGAALSAAWVVVSPATRAQEPSRPVVADVAPIAVDEIEQTTRAYLEQAQQYFAARQWGEAVETLRRVMETDGAKLLAVPDAADAPFVRYTAIRAYGQTLLSRWIRAEPAVGQQYRQLLDPLAERWFQDFQVASRAEPLTRIADQLLHTSRGDDALWFLGGIALERGDFVQARGFWERLHPALRSVDSSSLPWSPPGRPLWLSIPPGADDARWDNLLTDLARAEPLASFLAVPGTDLSLAEIRARLVLVSILEGAVERAGRERQLFERLHADAQGTLAGRSGRLGDILRDLQQESRQWPSPAAAGGWSTYAGDPTRQRQVQGDIDIGGQPLWRVSLPRVDASEERLGHQEVRVAEDERGALSYFPVVVGRGVYFAQANAVRALDLESGRALFADADREMPEDPTVVGRFYAGLSAASLLAPPSTQYGITRFTLTGTERMLFARLGSPITRWRDPEQAATRTRGYLVGFDLTAEGRLLPSFPWETEGPQWSFEGTPLCDGRRLYILLKRQDDVRAEAHVAAFDLTRGQLLWRRFLGAAETPGQGRWNEVTHNLLASQHDTLYCNTNLGVVAAVDRRDGRLLWLVKYPRVPTRGQIYPEAEGHRYRDLVPALVDRDRVILAPADSDRIFCLEAFSGQVLWSTRPGQAADAVHLMGVGEGFVIAAGDALYWLDVLTGAVCGQFPTANAARPGFARAAPRGYGRGLLADGRVYWPTREAIYVFRQRPQSTEWGWVPIPARAPLSLAPLGVRGGNLVAADNVLLIAGPDELVAFRRSGR